MFATIYDTSLTVLGGLGTAFADIIDFLFNHSIAYHIDHFYATSVFSNPLFSPITSTITMVVVNNNEFLTTTSLGEFILGSGIITLIGFTIIKYVLEIVK